MSYIVKNNGIKLLVSFSKDKEDQFMLLATNFKQFYVQRNIKPEYIEQKFSESDTRIKIPIMKIVKIIKEVQPSESEIKLSGKYLDLNLAYTIKTARLCDKFRIDFKLEECTSPSEIGVLFMAGLVKTIISEKAECKESLSLPQVFFEADISMNEANVSDLCDMIGGDVKVGHDKQESDETIEMETTQSSSKRHHLAHQEFKFEKLDDSQEFESPKAKKKAEITAKVDVKKKKKINVVKF